MGADLERHLRRIAGEEVVLERGLHQGAERPQPRARGDGVGRIGRDQQRRAVAAPDRALETTRDFDAEQHLARLQEIVELRDIAHLVDEVEIGAVLQRLQDRAPEIAVLLQQHRGRQIVRRGIDGVAEQQKLHHRKHDDHGERHAIAPELDEFLDHHRIAAPPEAESRLPRTSVLAGLGDDAHWKLSFERVISSMNTSSSDGSPCCQCHPGSRDKAQWCFPAPPCRGRRHAGWCRTAPPCRCRACR